MAAFDATRTSYGSHGLAGRIAALIFSAPAMLSAWNDARNTRNALAKLSDRELEDIGLIRGDIDAVAEGQYRR